MDRTSAFLMGVFLYREESQKSLYEQDFTKLHQGFFAGPIIIETINETAEKIHGILEEKGGTSKIEGIIDQSNASIQFTKEYTSGALQGQRVEYFVLKTNDNYSGHWKNGGMSGRAICAIIMGR